MTATIMPVCENTVDWINANHRKGVRLGVGGPLIRSTSIDHKPAMLRSDGVLVVVVEHGLKRHRLMMFKPNRTLTLEMTA